MTDATLESFRESIDNIDAALVFLLLVREVAVGERAHS